MATPSEESLAAAQQAATIAALNADRGPLPPIAPPDPVLPAPEFQNASDGAVSAMVLNPGVYNDPQFKASLAQADTATTQAQYDAATSAALSRGQQIDAANNQAGAPAVVYTPPTYSTTSSSFVSGSSANAASVGSIGGGGSAAADVGITGAGAAADLGIVGGTPGATTVTTESGTLLVAKDTETGGGSTTTISNPGVGEPGYNSAYPPNSVYQIVVPSVTTVTPTVSGESYEETVTDMGQDQLDAQNAQAAQVGSSGTGNSGTGQTLASQAANTTTSSTDDSSTDALFSDPSAGLFPDAAGAGQDPAAAASDTAASPTASTANAAIVLPTNSSQVKSAPSVNNNSSSTSEMFFAAKGTYYVVDFPTNSGKGIYAVEGLNKFNWVAEDAAMQQQRSAMMNDLADQQAQALSDFDADTSTTAEDTWQADAIQASVGQSTSSTASDLYGESYDSEGAAEIQGNQAAAANGAGNMYRANAADAAQSAADDYTSLEDAQDQQQQLTQQWATQDAATKAARLAIQAVPILIMGIETNQADIVAAMECLGNLKIFYTMGQRFADMKIIGQVLLGPLGNGAVDGVAILNQFFNKYRVSISHATITVSIATQAYEFFLTGMTFGDIDVDKHTLPFALGGIAVDPANGDLASINPAYTINTTLTSATAPQVLTQTPAGKAAAAAALSATAPAVMLGPPAPTPAQMASMMLTLQALASGTAITNGITTENTSNNLSAVITPTVNTITPATITPTVNTITPATITPTVNTTTPATTSIGQSTSSTASDLYGESYDSEGATSQFIGTPVSTKQ